MAGAGRQIIARLASLLLDNSYATLARPAEIDRICVDLDFLPCVGRFSPGGRKNDQHEKGKYHAEAAVLSAGQQSIARNNIAHAEQPYNDMQTAIHPQRKVQSFEQALTERFIAIQTQRDTL